MRLIGIALLIASAAHAQDETVTLTDWRVKNEDNPAWSRSDFDDSNWNSGTGPTRLGGSSLTELKGERVMWYRSNFRIPAWWSGRALALGVGPINDSYEVFVNGVKIGYLGSLPADGSSPGGDDRLVSFVPRHCSYSIPRDLIRDESVHIAFRVWTLRIPNGFSIHNSIGISRPFHLPVIGLATTVIQSEKLHPILSFLRILPNICLWLLTLTCGLFCLWLYLSQGADRELLWLGIALSAAGGSYLIGIPMELTDWIPKTSFAAFVWTWGTMVCSNFFFCWFLSESAPPMRRVLRWAAFPIAALDALWIMNAWLRIFPVPLTMQAHVLGGAGIVAAGLAVVWFTLSTGRFGLAMTSLGVALRGVAILLTSYDNVLNRMSIGSISFQFRTFADTVIAFGLVAILYSRFRRVRAHRQETEQDLLAARRIQEILLGADKLEALGFDLAVSYHPAKQVGGDFYFLAPGTLDGSLLVVVGDVSGKGLQAAILVASVIGSLRNESSRSPAEVLAHLNHALAGRTGGGFVTCCCALVTCDGDIVVANAGHLAPYLDGREMEVESGLPLGLTAGVEYAETWMKKQQGTLTFMSDGVVEAADAKGELLGFERTRAISLKSAAEIASSAQAWGQNDDITVVTVRRTT